MNITFRADPIVGKIFEAYSLDCIDMARRNFGVELELTEDSIQQIEMIAGKLHDDQPPQGVPEEVLVRFQKYLGSHIAHVLVEIRGWTPGIATFPEGQIEGVELPGKNMCWPWGKARNRLLNGPEDNLWHYYLGVTDQLGPPVDVADLAPPASRRLRAVGYSLHIERRTPAGLGTIEFDELARVIESDPTLSFGDHGVEFSRDRQDITLEDIVDRGESPNHAPDYLLSTLKRDDGSVAIELMFDPFDAEYLRKALDVARSLTAVISGDDGDVYSLDDDGQVTISY